MTLIHRLFAIATFTPLALWLLALGGSNLVKSFQTCTAEEDNPEVCTVFGMDAGQISEMTSYFSSLGLPLLAAISFGAAVLWALFYAILIIMGHR